MQDYTCTHSFEDKLAHCQDFIRKVLKVLRGIKDVLTLIDLVTKMLLE